MDVAMRPGQPRQAETRKAGYNPSHWDFYPVWHDFYTRRRNGTPAVLPAEPTQVESGYYQVLRTEKLLKTAFTRFLSLDDDHPEHSELT